MNGSEEILKIMFLGLDNSGKTSILYALENAYNKINNIKPTMNYTTKKLFNILGFPIYVWDLGGQKKFREKFMKHPEYFENVNLVFYVIDVQDNAKFYDSIQYFLKIWELLENMRGDKIPQITFLLHKVDPAIKDDPKVRENINTIQNLFDRLPQKFMFYNSSIYDREELVKSFSTCLRKIFPIGSLINDVLNNFLIKTNSDAIVLMDKNVLTLAEVANDSETLDICNTCGPFFTQMAEKLRSYKLKIPEIIEAKFDGWLFFKSITVKNESYYLVIFCKKEDNFQLINNYLQSITESLSNVIKYVL